MGILLDPNRQLINIDIYYIEEIKPPHNISLFHFIRSAKDMEDWKKKGYKLSTEIAQTPVQPNTPGMPAAITKIINKITIVCKRITWKDQNMLWSQTTKFVPTQDGKTQTDFDAIKYRELKLKLVLKNWDLKDPEGNPIDINIDNLAPDVAQEFLSTYEKVAEPTETDLKN